MDLFLIVRKECVSIQKTVRRACVNQIRGISHFSSVKLSGSRATSKLWAGSIGFFVRVSIGRRT